VGIRARVQPSVRLYSFDGALGRSRSRG
jgi:hypothetical protein